MPSRFLRFSFMLFLLVFSVSFFLASSIAQEEATATPTETPSETATSTDIPTETPSPTETAIPTETPTLLPSETPTATATNTSENTPAPSETATNTETPTATSTYTPTFTPSPTFTATMPPNVLMPNTDWINWHEDSHSYITYGGSWSTTDSTSASAGQYHSSSTSGSSMSFSFYGRGFALKRQTNVNAGNIQVCVDGNCQTVSNNSASTAWKVPFWVDNLSLGVHQVVITNSENKNFRPDAVYVYGDYVNYPVGSYEATSFGVHYYGDWISNGTRRESVSLNAEYAFAFTGQQFSLVRDLAGAGVWSNMEVCIDGNCQTVSNTGSSTLPIGNHRRANFGPFTEGYHVVTVRSLGAQPINLHRIEVHNSSDEVLQPSTSFSNWYEEDHPYINYTGGWTWKRYLGEASGSAAMEANQSGSVMQFRFEGTGFGLKRETNTNRSNIQICIDGVCQIVSNVTSTQVWENIIWIDGLSSGIHNVTITTQNASLFIADSLYIYNYVPATASNILQPSTSWYEDNHSYINYPLGTWGTNTSNNASGSNYHSTSTTDSEMRFFFSGRAFSLKRSTNSTYGNILICVDGRCRVVSNNSSSLLWQQQVWFSGLSMGTHEVVISNLDARTFQPDAVYVFGDYANLTEGVYQAETADIQYYGQWTNEAIGTASERRVSVSANGSYAFAFTGQQFSIVRHLAAAATYSDMEVCVDGVCQTVTNTGSSSLPLGGQRRANFGPFTEGYHIVTVRALGTLPISIDRLEIYNDSLEVLQPNSAWSGWYEEDHPYLNYTGTWNWTRYLDLAYGSAAMETSQTGAVMQFRFQGTGFALLRETNSARGSVNVCIDGVCQSVSNVTGTQVWQSPFWFGNLSNGVHEVVITTSDNKSFRPDAVHIYGARNPLPVGLHEETSNDIHYFGVWTSANSGSASGGTYRSTVFANSTVAFEFTGTHALFYHLTETSDVEICVDGSCYTYQNSGVENWNSGLRIGPFPEGTHAVRIRSLSTDSLILDRVEVYSVVGTNICLNLSSFTTNQGIEGANVLFPNFTLSTLNNGAQIVREGSNPPGFSSGGRNNRSVRDGIWDSNEDSNYVFSLSQGTFDAFSLWLLDYGDYNPYTATNYQARLAAYDANGQLVTSQSHDFVHAQVNGDALAPYGEAGNFLFAIEGEAITEVRLEFQHNGNQRNTWTADPQFALASICFDLQNNPELEVVSANASYVEDNAPVAVLTSVTATNGPTLVGATVTLENLLDAGLETLAVNTTGTSITANWNGTTGILTLAGTDTLANYELVLESLTYVNSSQNPDETERAITIVLSNSSGQSNEASVTVAVVAVNDAPQITAQAVTTAYKGGTQAVLASALISDVDDTNLESATITLQSPLNGVDEILALSGTNPNITVAWNAETSQLLLTGSETLANYQSLIASLTYSNSAETLFGINRQIQIEVSDGEASGSTSVVYAFNQRPVLNLSSANAVYVEGSAPIAIVVNTVEDSPWIFDADDTNIESATIQLLNFPDGAAEVLDVTVPAGVTKNFADGVLSLTGSASLDAYEAIIASLTYVNNSNNPNTTVREVELTVSDGSLSSMPVRVRVNLQHGNSVPVVNLNVNAAGEPNFSLPYTENQGTVPAVGEVVSVTDADSPIMSMGITFNLPPLADNEVLGFNTSLVTAENMLVWSYNDGILLIQGSAPAAIYQAILQSLSYTNNSDNPPSTREILVLVSDGENTSEAVTITITITPVNDAPSLNLDSNNSTGLSPDVERYLVLGTESVIVTEDTSIFDADSAEIDSATVTLVNILDGTNEGLSLVSTDPAITVSSYDFVTGVITLDGPASWDAFEAVLENLSYFNNLDIPSATDREIEITVSDGSLESAVRTSTIHLEETPTLPDDHVCSTWLDGQPHGWTAAVENSIDWDASGMYGVLDDESVTAVYEFTDGSIFRKLLLDVYGAGEYEVLVGAALDTPVEIGEDAYYNIPGDKLAIRWLSGAGSSDGLVFTSFCFDNGNVAPEVDAGSDLTIYWPEDEVALDAEVSDLNDPLEDLVITWTVVSGPEDTTPSFSDENITNPVFTVLVPGTYVLEISVSDGELITTDTVTINFTNVSNGLPDLLVTHVDINPMSLNPGTLAVSGAVNVVIANVFSGDDVLTDFVVSVFEDRNANGVFDSGVDTILGTSTQDGLAASASLNLAIPVSGQLQAASHAIFAFVDSTTLISEIDEANNLLSYQQVCPRITGEAFGFQQVWRSTYGHSQVGMAPVVADVDNDGNLDVIYVGGHATRSNIANLVIIDARDGLLKRLIPIPSLYTNSLVVADTDADGDMDIIYGTTNVTYIYDYASDTSIQLPAVGSRANPLVANLDGATTAAPEIIFNNFIFRWDGTAYAQINTATAGAYIYGVVGSTLADLDNDGTAEIIVGNKVFSAAGAPITSANMTLPTHSYNDFYSPGYLQSAVADFNLDGQLEIVLTGYGNISLYQRIEGSASLAFERVWSKPLPIQVGGAANSMGNGARPAIADYDGDGIPEIAVAAVKSVSIYEANGDVSIYRTANHNLTDVTAFDYDGNGRYEIIYKDLKQTLVLSLTSSGLQLIGQFNVPNGGSAIVADIDADGQSEVLLGGNDNPFVDNPRQGLYAFESNGLPWTPSRPIWNQHAYTVSNIENDGTLPDAQLNNPWNNFRAQVQPTPCNVGQPDWTIRSIDSEPVNLNLSTLQVSGSVAVEIRNDASSSLPIAFQVLVFEDLNNNHVYDAGTDTSLGTSQLSPLMADGSKNIPLNIPLSGQVSSPNYLLHVMVDATNTIPELHEDNNIKWQALVCEVPRNLFRVNLEYRYNASTDSLSIPKVGDVTGDGLPEVFFGLRSYPDTYEHTLVVLDGATHNVLFTKVHADFMSGVHPSSNLAIADIDLDGQNEIMMASNARIVAMEGDGTVKWYGDSRVVAGGVISIADINHDGSPEILYGGAIYNNQGHFFSAAWNKNDSAYSMAVDLEAGGDMEILLGGRAYRSDGSLLFDNIVSNGTTTYTLNSGLFAIANLDSDAQAEIVQVQNAAVYARNHDGSYLWGPIAIPQGGGGFPAAADVNGDGMAEIGVSGRYQYILLNNDGTIRWQQGIVDNMSAGVGSSFFDLNGDGDYEIVHRDTNTFRVFDALTGTIITTYGIGSTTLQEYPVIADWDVDGHAEILIVGNGGGLFVLGNDDVFVATRAMWNQEGYHITNINDDGSVPTYEDNNWESFNNFRANLGTDPCVTSMPDLAASYLRATETPTEITVQARVTNMSNINVPSGVNVSFYNGNPRVNGVLLGTVQTTIDLDWGEFTDVTLTLPAIAIAKPLWAVVDDAGTGDNLNLIAGAIDESNESNNLVGSRIYIIDGTNLAPVVDAGENATWDTADTSPLALDGTVSDDGLPINLLRINWTIVEQPEGALVTFTDASLADTTVSFSEAGTYVLALTADDGEFVTSSESIVITVTAPLEPEPPSSNTPLDMPGCIATPLNFERIYGIVPITLQADTVLTEVTVDYWPAAHPELYNESYILAEIEDTSVTDASRPDPLFLVDFDTTLLANDSYIIRVVGRNPDGSVANCGVMVTVTGEYKPGRVVLSTTDFSIPLAGLPITVGRTYDSLERNLEGDFGYGWNLALGNPRLEIDPANNVTLTMPDGTRKTFYHQIQPQPILPFAFSSYVAEPGVYGSFKAITVDPVTGDEQTACPLLTNSGGQWFCVGGSSPHYQETVQFYVYTDPYGREFTYSPDGQLVSIKDLSGNVLSFEEGGIRSSLTGELLVTIRREDTTLPDRITSIVDNAGNVYSYHYNDQGELEEVVLPVGNPDTPEPDDFATVQYFYYDGELAHHFWYGVDSRGNTVVSTTYNADGRLETVTDVDGNVTTYTYPEVGDGGTTRVYPPYPNDPTPSDITDNPYTETSYDEVGNVLSERDELGRITSYEYNASNQVIEVSNPAGEVTLYAYDNRGNRKNVVIDMGPSNLTLISATYNQYGGPSTLTDANGEVRYIVYNEQGMPESASDDLGPIGSYEWNAQGSPEIICDANIPTANCGDEPGERFTSRFTYDVYGNVSSQTDALGRISSFAYDDMGHRTHSCNAEVNSATCNDSNYSTKVTYDVLGRVLTVVERALVGGAYVEISHISYSYDANGNRTSVNQDGRISSYLYDENNRVERVTYPDGSFSTTAYDWRGNVTVQTEANGVKTCYGYDAAGQLTDVVTGCESLAPLTTHYIYDLAGRRIRTYEVWNNACVLPSSFNFDTTLDPSCGVMVSRVEYNPAGRVTRTGDTSGMITTYDYDAAGQLRSVTYAAGTAFAATHSYTYDERGRRTQVRYPDNSIVTMQYDGVGRMTRQIDVTGLVSSFEYDYAGQLLLSTRGVNTGSNAIATAYIYDNLGRQVQTVANYKNGYSLNAPWIWNAATSSWSDGTSTVDHGSNNDQNIVSQTSYSFNSTGQLVTNRDTLGHTTTSQSNVFGEIVSYTDARGNTTSYSTVFNTALHQRSETVTYPDATYETSSYINGQLVTQTVGQSSSNPLGFTTSYTYDNAGRLVGVCDASVTTCNASTYTTSYGYDNRGRQTSVTDALQHTTSYVYDNAGRLERVCDASVTCGSFPNVALGSYTQRYEYDILGRRTSQWDAAGNITEYHYDKMGRLLWQTNPHGAGDTVLYQLYRYNAAGQRIEVSEGNLSNNPTSRNHVTSYGYDAFGRLLSVTNPAGEQVSYGYDALTRVQSIRNGNGVETRFNYDALGQLTAKIWPDDATESYQYDANGNMIVQDVPNSSNNNSFVYDTMNRLVHEVYWEGNTLLEFGYNYDSRGLLSEVYNTYPSATAEPITEYSYDALGRPLSVVHADTLQRINYAYDAAGNRILMETGIIPSPSNLDTYNSQSFVSYSYDNLNRLRLLREHDAAALPANGSWANWLANPAGATSAWAGDSSAAITSFDYNELGLLETIARPNHINTTYSYESPQNPYWVTEIEHYNAEVSLPADALVSRYSYTYDNLGNRSSMTEESQSGAISYSYSYDAANRLIGESLEGTSNIRSYSYDRAGNRLTSTYMGEVTRYFYNSSDELYLLLDGDLMQQHFEYDDAGNLKKQQGILGIVNYTYNSRNQLTDINGDAVAYDYAGRRIQTNFLDTETNYLWDEFSQYSDVILETNAYNQYERHYSLANGMLISQTDTIGSLYFLSDAQNSTQALTDEDGLVTSSYSYDAFGNLDDSSSLAETKYLYTGQQYDASTELYSLRARYYDPTFGRFTSRDKWAYNYRNPIELNRYVYAVGNPVMYKDPSGYSGLLEFNWSINWSKVGRDGLLGGVAGFAGSTYFYLAAKFGRCGSALDQWADTVDPIQFVKESTVRGIAGGVIYSTLAQINPLLGLGYLLTGMGLTIADLSNADSKHITCAVEAAIVAKIAVNYVGGSGNSDMNDVDTIDSPETTSTSEVPEVQNVYYHPSDVPDKAYLYAGPDNWRVADGMVDGIVSAPDSGPGHYISFDRYDTPAEAQSYLQLPMENGQYTNPATIRFEIDTAPIMDEIRVPFGYHDNSNFQIEPTCRCYPQWGEGGGSQAVVNAPLPISRIVNIETGQILYEKPG